MKIKKVLCSVLATVMAASVLSVGMVTSAMAAEIVDGSRTDDKSVPTFHTIEGDKTTWDFTKAGNRINGPYTASQDDTLDGIYIVQATADTVKIKKTDNDLDFDLKSGVAEQFGIPVFSTSGNIKITCAAKSDIFITLVKKSDGLKDDTTKQALSDSGAIYTYSEDNIQEKNGQNYVIFEIDDEGKDAAAKIHTIELTETAPDRSSMLATGTADSTETNGVAVVKGFDGAYYAVAVISDTKAQESTTLTLTADGGTQPTGVVYNSAELGNAGTWTASELGGGNYVYAVKLSGAGATGDPATIQAKITASYE